MSTLADALIALKTELTDAAQFGTLTTEIAADYDLNPVLLARKFLESYGTPAAVVALRETTAVLDLVAQDHALTAAKTAAARWADQYAGIDARYFGKTFSWQDDQFVFVVIDGGCHKWGIKAVRVRDNTKHQFSLPTWSKIAPQLGA